MEQDNNQSTTPIIKKSKGPVICSALCIILALAGIGFGVYGMFFNKTSAPAAGDKETTTVVEKEAPSIAEVTKVLNDKYDFSGESEYFCGPSVVFGVFTEDGMTNEFDDSAKLAYTIRRANNTDGFLSDYNCSDAYYCNVKSVTYEKLNNLYHKYFGNDYNIEKKNYDLEKYYFVLKEAVKYDTASDSFIITFPEGIGCGLPSDGIYAKVYDVKATEKGFVANMALVYANFDSEETFSYFEKMKMFKADFSFIEEDGEYKLVDIVKK